MSQNSVFQEAKSDEDTLAIKCRRFQPHPNINFGNREALIYNILRDEGCNFKKSLIFSTKKNCRIDNTKTHDGPTGFRILKQKQTPGFLTNRGWCNSQPGYDFNNEQFVSVKEVQKEDSHEQEISQKFDACKGNIKKDLMRSLYYLNENKKQMNEKYNFSKIKSKKLQYQKIKEVTENTRKQRQNQKILTINNVQFSQLAEELFDLRKKQLSSQYTDILDNLNVFQDVLLFDFLKTANLKYQYESKLELENVAYNPHKNIIEDLKNRSTSIWNYEEKQIEKLKQNFQNVLKKVDGLSEVQKAEYIEKLIKLHDKKQNIDLYNSQYYLYDKDKNQEKILQQEEIAAANKQNNDDDDNINKKKLKIGLSKQDRQKIVYKNNLKQLKEQNIYKQTQFNILYQKLVEQKEIDFLKKVREKTPQTLKEIPNSRQSHNFNYVQQLEQNNLQPNEAQEEDLEQEFDPFQNLMDPQQFQKNFKKQQRKFSERNFAIQRKSSQLQEPEQIRLMQKIEIELSVKDSQKTPKNSSFFLESNQKNFYNNLDQLCQTKQQFLEKFIKRNFIEPGQNYKNKHQQNLKILQNTKIKSKSLHNNYFNNSSNLLNNSQQQQQQNSSNLFNSQQQQQQKNQDPKLLQEIKKQPISKDSLKINLNLINKQDFTNNQSQLNKSSTMSNNQSASNLIKSVRFDQYLSKTSRNYEKPNIQFNQTQYQTKIPKLKKQYYHEPLQNIENYQQFIKIQKFQESSAAQSLQVSPRESLHNFSNMMQSNQEIPQ